MIELFPRFKTTKSEDHRFYVKEDMVNNGPRYLMTKLDIIEDIKNSFLAIRGDMTNKEVVELINHLALAIGKVRVLGNKKKGG